MRRYDSRSEIEARVVYGDAGSFLLLCRRYSFHGVTFLFLPPRFLSTSAGVCLPGSEPNTPVFRLLAGATGRSTSVLSSVEMIRGGGG